MQRSSVVLPDPLGPITTTTSPGCTDSDTPRSTSSVPKRFDTPTTSSIGRSMTVDDTSLEISAIECQCVAYTEVDCCGAQEDLERCERAFDDLAACHRQFPQSDD